MIIAAYVGLRNAGLDAFHMLPYNPPSKILGTIPPFVLELVDSKVKMGLPSVTFISNFQPVPSFFWYHVFLGKYPRLVQLVPFCCVLLAVSAHGSCGVFGSPTMAGAMEVGWAWLGPVIIFVNIFYPPEV